MPQIVRAIAWKAQVRLCARYRRLMAAGKRQTVVTTAIAREMAAFLWAIGREIQPARPHRAERAHGHCGGPDQFGLTSAFAQHKARGLGGESSYKLCGR